MKLTPLFASDRVFLDLDAGNKTDTLTHLCLEIAGSLGISDSGAVARVILDREEIMSTGMGEGIAIPHAKSPLLDDLQLAFARISPPIHFDAPDGKVVDLLFLLVGPPEKTSEHVQVLAALARMLQRRDVPGRLRSMATADEFFELLAEVDTEQE
jgi:PTS system nitrogen regulatory IIA component